MKKRTGGCLCGSVRYQVVGEGRHVTFCHCRSCRLAAGSAGVAWVTFDPEGWQVLSGEPVRYPSSDGIERSFCGNCGSALTYRNTARPREIDVTLSTLDDPEGLDPERHIWVSHKPAWLVLGDGLPQFAEWASASPPTP